MPAIISMPMACMGQGSMGESTPAIPLRGSESTSIRRVSSRRMRIIGASVGDSGYRNINYAFVENT